MNARRALAIAMLVVPLAITVTALLVIALAGGDLGREVAVHWGPDGPDGWAPAWTTLVLGGAVGLGLPVLMWLSMGRGRRVSGTVVFLAGFVIWLTGFLGVSMSAALIEQPADAGWWLLVAAGVGLALAVPAWLWLPREPAVVVEPAQRARIELAQGEVAAWSASVASPRGFLWLISVVIVFTVGASILATVNSHGRVWFVIIIPVLLTVMLLLTLGWRVTAGPAGLTVRGLIGLPVFRVRGSDIVDAVAIDLDPIADFGGWGIRWALTSGGRSRTGIVARAGEALQVTRRDGREFVVTVDDAATAAAVLRAHAATQTA